MALCDRCGKNPATIHVSTTVNGKVTEENLCSECARESGVWKDPFMSFAQMMAGMTGETVRPQKTNTLRCSKCGYDFSRFRETGLLGCPQCYEDFREYLNPMIRRIHGSLTHLGERPGQVISDPVSTRINELQRQLTEAVQNEEYEKAVELRDEIRAIKEKGENHADTVE